MVIFRRAASVVESVLAHAEMSYLRSIAPGGSCVCMDGLGSALEPLEVSAALGYTSGPVLLVYWIADAMPVALLPFIHPAFRETAREVRFVFDDTFWGRVCARFQEGLGGRRTVLARRGNPDRFRQLRSLMAGRESCALAVDGGGPYRFVSTGLASLAGALGASIIPVAVRTTPGLTVPKPSRVRVPLPRSRVAVVIGAPIPVRRNASRSRVADEVRRALNELGSIAGTAPAVRVETRQPELRALHRS